MPTATPLSFAIGGNDNKRKFGLAVSLDCGFCLSITFEAVYFHVSFAQKDVHILFDSRKYICFISVSLAIMVD